MKEAEGCTCDECKAMSQRPCWPTPQEAKRLIAAGFKDRLMADYWIGDDGDNIYLLCPAITGYECGKAPFWPSGKCTFQDKNGLCELHDLGLKPIEGRIADCKRQPDEDDKLHEMVAISWNYQSAQNLCNDFMTHTSP